MVCRNVWAQQAGAPTLWFVVVFGRSKQAPYGDGLSWCLGAASRRPLRYGLSWCLGAASRRPYVLVCRGVWAQRAGAPTLWFVVVFGHSEQAPLR